jgi:hypothetical protein
MGYFWDELERKWISRPRRERTHRDRRRVARRDKLLTELVAEIEDARAPARPSEGEDEEYFAMTQRNDRAAKLYAALLVRALVGTDELLMKNWGERIARVTAGGERVKR